MNKLSKLPLSILIVIFTFLTTDPYIVYSQSATNSAVKEDLETRSFEQIFQEYLSKIDEYEKAHEDYILKRAQYFRFGTLKSRDDAQAATLSMLQARDEVMILYIKSLKAKHKESVGISDVKREGFNLRLNEEVAWFENHKEVMTSAGSLADLVRDSDSAKNRYYSLYPLAYEVLATNSLGRLTDFQERVNDSFNQTKDKIELIKNEDRDEYKISENKIKLIDRWIFESENKITRGLEKQTYADSKIPTFGLIPGTTFGEYNNTLSVMGEAQLFYKEACSFLKEVIREIKTKD